MTDQEKIDDYDRLKLEYTRLHEDYRRLCKHKTKQLNILDVSSSCGVIGSNSIGKEAMMVANEKERGIIIVGADVKEIPKTPIELELINIDRSFKKTFIEDKHSKFHK